MPDESKGPVLQIDIKEMMKEVVASQQPFFTALLNQIAATEARQTKMGETLMDVRDSVHLLVNQELHQRLHQHDQRIAAIEASEYKRSGIRLAVEAAPKYLGWLAALIIVILSANGYLPTK